MFYLHRCKVFVFLFLVMEQSNSCKCHGNTIFVTGINDMIITDRAARLSNVAYSASVSTFYVVAEREECIGTKRYVCILV